MVQARQEARQQHINIGVLCFFVGTGCTVLLLVLASGFAADKLKTPTLSKSSGTPVLLRKASLSSIVAVAADPAVVAPIEDLDAITVAGDNDDNNDTLNPFDAVTVRTKAQVHHYEKILKKPSPSDSDVESAYVDLRTMDKNIDKQIRREHYEAQKERAAILLGLKKSPKNIAGAPTKDLIKQTRVLLETDRRLNVKLTKQLDDIETTKDDIQTTTTGATATEAHKKHEKKRNMFALPKVKKFKKKFKTGEKTTDKKDTS